MALLGKEQIIQTLLEDEMQNSYLDYSMSVIVSRALPDVRDGLKPVHRRILYAAQELGLAPNRPHKKSARLVGEVLGKYHPHGDSSVYDAMVRLAQSWNVRYPLFDGQGNYGSVDNDPPAAMRYTETRLSHVATSLLEDLQKNTVDFRPNFDDSLEEPIVLPSNLPTLLVNGSSGIAVGMATNMPPHNLREVVKGIIALIDNPELTIEELMQYVPAPDFPTGGIIYGYQGVKDAYLTGRGKIIVRARAAIEEVGNKERIVIDDLPYQVNKAGLIEKIADLSKNKAIEGISYVGDESGRDGQRIVIDLKRDAVPMVVLNNLYKQTQMQVTFGVINLALVNGRPKELTLKELMYHFIEHRNDVVIRRTKFDLEAAEKRAHILEGFLIALNNIDEVIKIIRGSKDGPEASLKLQDRFELSEIQAKAILDMRLQRLTGLERDKIEKEYNELLETIKELKAILASKELQLNIISDELQQVAEKYGDERRTEIIHDSREFSIEDMIANEDVIVSITKQGFIKRTKLSNYRRQNKGGRGSSGAKTHDDDFIEHVFQAPTHHNLLFFTGKGRVFKVKVYDLPEGSRNSKGRSLANVIMKDKDEVVTAYQAVDDFSDDKYVVMCTQNGTIKKTQLSAFSNVRQNGIIAINLNDDDQMIEAEITDGSADILLGTENGIACRFRESDVRSMGRTAAGVRGISLGKGDIVKSMVVIKRPDTQILVVGENGYGKRTNYEDFRLTKRGAKGVIAMNITDKTGKVVGLLSAFDTQDLVVMTTNGIIIRQTMSAIRTIGRNTQGVRLIKLGSSDSIADIASVTSEPNEDDDNDDNQNEIGNEGLQETLL
ncbi:DNA gyrase subunit A [Candidatus Kapabacteria bacterium]|nr:DNA gyrase subunit A [Candidatus Kapabacteria bacterium]